MNLIFKNEKEKKQAIIGLLLGDGSRQGNTIEIMHGKKQRFYIEWLEEICKNNNIQYTVKYDFVRNTTFGVTTDSRIRMIDVLKDNYFKKNLKTSSYTDRILNESILEAISPLGLLFWYLDDGCLNVSYEKVGRCHRFAYLNTQCFSYDENILIKDMLYKRFNISTSIHIDRSGIEKHKHKKYYRIYINAENFRRFFDLVKPYFKFIPKEFYYKFDMKYKPNKLKSSILYSKLYNMTPEVIFENYQNQDSYRKGKKFEELFGEKKAKELRQGLSETAKKRTGEKNPFYGKVHTEETKKKVREKMKGKKPVNQKSVLIDGITYPSVTEASRQLNVVPATIIHRIKSKNKKYSRYSYIEKDVVLN